jgi:hypothetical protein
MKSLFILGMVLFGANTFAGNEKGNGGGIHYCQGQETQELYDIYEAQARYGYEIKDDKSPVNAQINKALAKIKKANPFIARVVEEKIKYLQNGHTIIREKIKLTPIGDAKILLVDEGCSYQQLANWDEVSGNLLVKKDYFDKMSNTNKAAFYIHETLYKVGRDLDLLTLNADGSTNSDEIRRMVGEIFSTNNSLLLIWNIEDPQIEIDRQKEVDERVKKQIKNFIDECSLAIGKAKEEREIATKVLTLDNVEKYATANIQANDICYKNSNYASDIAESILTSSRFVYQYVTAAATITHLYQQNIEADSIFSDLYIKK